MEKGYECGVKLWWWELSSNVESSSEFDKRELGDSSSVCFFFYVNFKFEFQR